MYLNLTPTQTQFIAGIHIEITLLILPYTHHTHRHTTPTGTTITLIIQPKFRLSLLLNNTAINDIDRQGILRSAIAPER